MKIKFGDIEDAFLFVGMDQKYMNNAILCRETGQIYYTSEIGDSEELPEDIYDTEKYIEIPHKTDLDLGKALTVEFTSKYLPDDLDAVYDIFRRKGAYSRYKNLLERRGLLDTWYKFENDRQTEALNEWCKNNNIETTG